MECGQCAVNRPITASHCYECGLCIDQLDHHCPVRAYRAYMIIATISPFFIEVYFIFFCFFSYVKFFYAFFFTSSPSCIYFFISSLFSVDRKVHREEKFKKFSIIFSISLFSHNFCSCCLYLCFDREAIYFLHEYYGLPMKMKSKSQKSVISCGNQLRNFFVRIDFVARQWKERFAIPRYSDVKSCDFFPRTCMWRFKGKKWVSNSFPHVIHLHTHTVTEANNKKIVNEWSIVNECKSEKQ